MARAHRQLLVPFEYYGVADAAGTDLEKVRWSRSGYQLDELSTLYTGNEARVISSSSSSDGAGRSVPHTSTRVLRLGRARRVHGERAHRARNPSRARLRRLTRRRSPARSAAAPRAVRNVLCTCDLYNEGVNLPFVDTLLLLRPTTSAALFMQQIGRGLRLFDGKSSCLILDFIGQHRAEFRFDGIYSAITGVPRGRLERDVREGFPYLPSGCVFQLDAVVKERVLASLKSAVASAAVLTRELREMAGRGADVTLGQFLDGSGREVEDVYRTGGWTALRARAGALGGVEQATLDLSDRLGRLLHTDDVSRLGVWKDAPSAQNDATYLRRLTMLEFELNHRGVLRDPTDGAPWLFGAPAIRDELSQLADVLTERVALAEEVYPVAEWPLALHRHYSRREIVAAVGFVKPEARASRPKRGSCSSRTKSGSCSS